MNITDVTKTDITIISNIMFMDVHSILYSFIQLEDGLTQPKHVADRGFTIYECCVIWLLIGVYDKIYIYIHTHTHTHTHTKRDKFNVKGTTFENY